MHTKLSPMRLGLATAGITLAALLAAVEPISAQQGGMMQQEMVDLSSPSPDRQVASLRYCDGIFHVTNGEGDTIEFPEFNLRFKVDGSDIGPPSGTPALVPSGMMGDRAFIIFAAPAEVSGFIDNEC